MSFYASNNRIWVTDANGATMFDTNRKMPAVTSVFRGSMTIGGVPAGAARTTRSHLIGNAPHGAEFVLATNRVTGVGSYPWANSFFNAGGSFITNLGWHVVSGTWRVGLCRSLSYIVSGGRIYLVEDYYNLFPGLSMDSFNLNYTVYIGSFT